MIAKYEVETIIKNALGDLNGLLSKPDQDGKCTIYEASVTEDVNGDLIFTFKEDCFDDMYVDKYKIKIEYL